jgi:hypothetical protein
MRYGCSSPAELRARARGPIPSLPTPRVGCVISHGVPDRDGFRTSERIGLWGLLAADMPDEGKDEVMNADMPNEQRVAALSWIGLAAKRPNCSSISAYANEADAPVSRRERYLEAVTTHLLHAPRPAEHRDKRLARGFQWSAGGP